MIISQFEWNYREISNRLTHQKLAFDIYIANVNLYKIMLESENMVNELVNMSVAVFIKRSRI